MPSFKTKKQDVDHVAVRELHLFITNCDKLYETRMIPIIKNLIRKINKGNYDHELSKKLWYQFASAGGKIYAELFGMNPPNFSTDVRHAVAHEMAEDFLSEYTAGEYDWLNTKAPNQYTK